jgi:hypothetical protein
MKSYKEISKNIQHLREKVVAGKHIRDINLDIMWSVVSGNSARISVAESLEGVSKRYVLNMSNTEFNQWLVEHRVLVEMFYDFATNPDIEPNKQIIESLSESLINEDDDFLKGIHTLIENGDYIKAYAQIKESDFEDLENISNSLYYFLSINEAFTIADKCSSSNPKLWDSILTEAERTIEDHPSLASLAIAVKWYMKEGGEWETETL